MQWPTFWPWGIRVCLYTCIFIYGCVSLIHSKNGFRRLIGIERIGWNRITENEHGLKGGGKERTGDRVLTRHILRVFHAGLSASWTPALLGFEEANSLDLSSVRFRTNEETAKRSFQDWSSLGSGKVGWENWSWIWHQNNPLQEVCGFISERRVDSCCWASPRDQACQAVQSAPEEDRGSIESVLFWAREPQKPHQPPWPL